MPPVHTELLRRAVRVVCEILIAELREILLQKKRRLQERRIAAGAENDAQSLLRNTLTKETPKRVTRGAARRRTEAETSAPQPLTFVTVNEMSMDDSAGGSEDQEGEAVDPWENIQIKQEVHDDLTFEEHFEDMTVPSIKTEVKEEDMFFENFEDIQDKLTSEPSSSVSMSKTKIEGDIQQEELSVNKREDTDVSSGKDDISKKAGREQESLAGSSFESAYPGQTEKPYVCKKCYKTFATFDELKKHVVIHNRNAAKHTCKKCGLKFSEVGKFKKHLCKHKGKGKKAKLPNTCKWCKRSYSKGKDLQKHKLLHYRAQLYASERIFQKYSKYYPKDKNMHLKLFSGQTYKCKHCVKRLICISDLVRHAYIHNKSQRYACPNITKVKRAQRV